LYTAHFEAKMQVLYRVATFIIRSGAASRQLRPWTYLRFSRFSNATNARNLSSGLIATDCRYLLNKAEMSSQVDFSGSASDSHNCDEGMDKSLDTGIDNAVKLSDLLEGEPLQTELDVSHIVPALPKKSFSLAAYVNESKTLRHLVMLGVNLSKIEECDISLAEQLVKLDFESDIKPALLLLHQCDVKECDIGDCITRNPRLLCESIDDMQVRVNYLESKRFTKESIATIVSKEPRVLTTATKETDVQLGYLQQDFMLTGTCC